MTISVNQTIQTQFRTIDGLSVRFAESEDRDDHALLLSPWPESLFAFAPMWSRLAEHTHLVAIDLPGSATPSAATLCCPRGRWASSSSASPTRSGSSSRMSSAPTSARGRALRRGPASGPAAQPRCRERRRRVSAAARRALKDWVEAPDLEASAAPTHGRSSPARWPASSGTRSRRRSRGLPLLLRRRPVRRVDALRARLPHGSAGPRAICCRRSRRRCRSSPARETRRCRRSTPSFSTSGCPTASSTSIDAGHFTWEDGADEYAALVTSWWGGGYATAGSAAAG